MATEVLMPRQGNTVESCVILEWKKNEGEEINQGDIICEVETDKAAFEVEAPETGVLLKRFFDEGDDVPVLTVIAAIGKEGEDVSGMAPSSADAEEPAEEAPAAAEQPQQVQTAGAPAEPDRIVQSGGSISVSPRARHLAEAKGIDFRTIAGTGPGGRIIERDIQYVIGSREPFSPAAIEAQLRSGAQAPETGSGLGGRILSSDLGQPAPLAASGGADFPGPVTELPVKGVRKLIAERMRSALASTAQLTLNSSADARAILSYRKKLKSSPEDMGLSKITINDFILYAASRNLLRFQELNAHFLGETIKQFSNVHLGFAVDTPRGLMVPVIRNAHVLTLRQISDEAKRLAKGCLEGGISPDELSGATFTITNLGAFGIESFTPIANAPEVAILGVNTVQPKPVISSETGTTEFIPHIGFSLTIDHQLVDGAAGARFLKALGDIIANFDVLLAG